MRSAVDNAIQRRRLEQKSRPQLSPFTNLDFDSTLTTHPTFPIFPARSSRSNANEDDSERDGTVSMGTLVRGQRSPKKVIGIGWGAGSTKGSSVPSPQQRTALAAVDVDGTFVRVTPGSLSDRKREHCPRAYPVISPHSRHTILQHGLTCSWLITR